MFEHKKLQNLDDFFTKLENRREKGVFFYRINGWNEEIDRLIRKYYETARLSGVVIEGRILNPTEANLDYYQEMMGLDFQMNPGFINRSLGRWLPRMNEFQRNQVAVSIYDTLDGLRQAGKNDNILKNAYIKFMCWFYYKFERIVNHLGEGGVPKILYEGEVSNYELLFLDILSRAGCDILLLQYRGDASYRKLDAQSLRSDELTVPGMQAFPAGYGLKRIQQEQQEAARTERLYGRKPEHENCTNAWITGKGLADILTPPPQRGTDPHFFYPCFIRITGVEDKLTYVSELYQFRQELKKAGRKVVVVNGQLPAPTMEEIAGIRRQNCQRQEQLLASLAANIQYGTEPELQRIMVKGFLDLMLAEAKEPGMNLNRLMNKGVYLLCWLKRYQGELFMRDLTPGCFIHMGPCGNENETLFLRLLARLPADVLILVPAKEPSCRLEDPALYEIHYEEALRVERFPEDAGSLQVGTAAYHAERELDTLMYRDTGMYRSYQYGKAEAVTLQTMYEEIAILWKEELKYRPGFQTVDDIVNMPVIFAKVSGVKDENVANYWAEIKNLITEDTYLVNQAPLIRPGQSNPLKSCAVEFLKNGRLRRDKIKSHREYRYGFLREEVQEHILDALQKLLDERAVRGIYENGMEYAVIATVLNLNKELVRMIQKFDYTKENPKLIYIQTGEQLPSQEDAILAVFLNLVGFDVAFFVPTGYQGPEKYFNRSRMEEHQIGEYVYDLRVPDFRTVQANTKAARPSWRDKIFKRGV